MGLTAEAEQSPGALKAALAEKSSEVSSLLEELSGWEETAGRLGDALAGSEARVAKLEAEGERTRQLLRGYEARLAHALRSHDEVLSNLETVASQAAGDQKLRAELLAARTKIGKLEKDIAVACGEAHSWKERYAEFSSGSVMEDSVPGENMASRVVEPRGGCRERATEAWQGDEVAGLKQEVALMQMLLDGSLSGGDARLDDANPSVRHFFTRLNARLREATAAVAAERDSAEARAQAMHWQRDILQAKLTAVKERESHLQRQVSSASAREAARRGDPTARDREGWENGLGEWVESGISEMHALVMPLRAEVGRLAGALGLPGDEEGEGEEGELLREFCAQLGSRLGVEREAWAAMGAQGKLMDVAGVWRSGRLLRWAWGAWRGRQLTTQSLRVGWRKGARRMDTHRRFAAFQRWRRMTLTARLELAEAGGEAALMIALAWGRWRTFYGARCLTKQHIARLHENAEASHMRMAFHAWCHSVGAAKSGDAEETADSAERYRAEAMALKEETARLRAQLAKMASHVRQLHQEVTQARQAGTEDTAAAEKLAVLLRRLLVGGSANGSAGGSMPLLDLHGVDHKNSDAKQLVELLERHFGLELLPSTRATPRPHVSCPAPRLPPPKPAKPDRPAHGEGADRKCDNSAAGPTLPRQPPSTGVRSIPPPCGSAPSLLRKAPRQASGHFPARVPTVGAAGNKPQTSSKPSVVDGPKPVSAKPGAQLRRPAPTAHNLTATLSNEAQLAAKAAVHAALLRHQRMMVNADESRHANSEKTLSMSGEDKMSADQGVSSVSIDNVGSLSAAGLLLIAKLVAAASVSHRPPVTCADDVAAEKAADVLSGSVGTRQRQGSSSSASSSTKLARLKQLNIRRADLRGGSTSEPQPSGAQGSTAVFPGSETPSGSPISAAQHGESTSMSASAVEAAVSAVSAAAPLPTPTAQLSEQALREAPGSFHDDVTFACAHRDSFLQDALEASMLHQASLSYSQHSEEDSVTQSSYRIIRAALAVGENAPTDSVHVTSTSDDDGPAASTSSPAHRTCVTPRSDDSGRTLSPLPSPGGHAYSGGSSPVMWYNPTSAGLPRGGGCCSPLGSPLRRLDRSLDPLEADSPTRLAPEPAFASALELQQHEGSGLVDSKPENGGEISVLVLCRSPRSMAASRSRLFEAQRNVSASPEMPANKIESSPCFETPASALASCMGWSEDASLVRDKATATAPMRGADEATSEARYVDGTDGSTIGGGGVEALARPASPWAADVNLDESLSEALRCARIEPNTSVGSDLAVSTAHTAVQPSSRRECDTTSVAGSEPGSVVSERSNLSTALAQWWRIQEAEWDALSMASERLPSRRGSPGMRRSSRAAAGGRELPSGEGLPPLPPSVASGPLDMEGEVAKVLRQLAVTETTGNAAEWRGRKSHSAQP